MKKNDCLCRRYTAKEWGNDETTIEVFIGYKLLREPSSSEPGQFTMVELRRTVTDGKAENWSETKLEGPFEAIFESPSSVESVGGWKEWQSYFSSTGNRLMADFVGKAIRFTNPR